MTTCMLEHDHISCHRPCVVVRSVVFLCGARFGFNYLDLFGPFLGPFTQNAKVPFASCACRASFSHTDTSKPPSLKILNELVSCTHPVLTSVRPHIKTVSGLCLANTRALFCSLHLHHFIMMIGIIPDIVTTLRLVMMYYWNMNTT